MRTLIGTFALLSSLSLAACSSGESCTVDGETVEDGETVDAEDGCNTCTCNDGTLACTEIACESDSESDAE